MPTFDDLERICLGEMRMSASDFYASDLRTIFNAIEGYQKSKDLQRQERLLFERYWVSVLIRPHYKKAIPPKTLLKFDFEEDEKTRQTLTPADVVEITKKWDKNPI